MRVALAQTAPVLREVEANLAATRECVASAVRQGAELVVFPELSLSGYSLHDGVGGAGFPRDDPRLAALSREFAQTGIVVGFPEHDGEAIYNSAALLQGGRVQFVHRKLYVPHYNHLREGDVFEAGSSLATFPHPSGRLALMICEDIVQPALGLLASQQDALLLIVVANSALPPSNDFDPVSYWNDMTRFFAVAFQMFVVFVNRTGQEGALRFWGGSRVIDPQGQLRTHVGGAEPELLYADVAVQSAARLRDAFPMLRAARLDLLSQELRRVHDQHAERREGR